MHYIVFYLTNNLTMQQIFNDFPLLTRGLHRAFSIPPPPPSSSPFRAGWIEQIGKRYIDQNQRYRCNKTPIRTTSIQFANGTQLATSMTFDIFFQWNREKKATKIKTVCSDFVLCVRNQNWNENKSLFCFFSLFASLCLFLLLLLLYRFSLFSLSLSSIRCCRNNANDLNVIATHSNSYLRRLKKRSKT